MNMVKRTYNPSGYNCISVVEVTEEQAIALDELEKVDEFDAYFWSEKVVWLNNGDVRECGSKVVRYKGVHYVLEERNVGFQGCGGAKYKIEFIDGPHKDKNVESNNVWHQGEIPEQLRDILKDNGTIKQETIEFDFLNNEIRKGDAL